MSDLIDREQAINALNREITKRRLDGVNDGTLDEFDTEDILRRLLSAEKTGKWIVHEDDWYGDFYECSVCGGAFTLIDGTPADNLYNYCPNCGARMVD